MKVLSPFERPLTRMVAVPLTTVVEAVNFSVLTTVVKGTATIRVRGLSKGDNTFTVRYSGTGSTAGFTKVYTLEVG